jgi:hypothetical protein
VTGYDRAMIARIKDIPNEQEATWGAVLAVLQFDHRDSFKFHWRADQAPVGAKYAFVEIEVPGEDVEGLRAEIDEVVDMVNGIADRDPLKTMTRADPGLVEVLVS